MRTMQPVHITNSMDSSTFSKTFAGVCALNDSEGPRQNVLEPKFQAREQFEALSKAIQAAIACKSADAPIGNDQLAQIKCVLVQNYLDTDEYANAETAAVTAFRYLLHSVNNSVEAPTGIDAVVSYRQVTDESTEFSHVATYLRVLNCVGIYLTGRSTAQRFSDSLKVLHLAEAVFEAWRAWKRLPLIAVSPAAWEEHREMSELFNSTAFYLAQCYGGIGDISRSSKYCFHTMVVQLVSRKDFAPKEWARNAVHLSGFFNGSGLFDESRHCMLAAENVMPSDNPDEETAGVVAWGFAKLYKARLRWFAERRDVKEHPLPDTLRTAEWWHNFPLPLPPVVQFNPISTFDEARDTFKESMKYLNDAAKFYVFDGCCTDFIEIQKDMSALYGHLMKFEPLLERRIAMQGRRIDLLKDFPNQLSFNAYGTIVRQLLFDIGDLHADLVDMRIEQRKQRSGTPLSDRAFNDLATIAQSWFERFVVTFHHTETKRLEKIDEENRVAVFRALMRIARLQSKRFHKTPKDEYDGIAVVIQKYEDTMSFAAKNALLEHPEVSQELQLAREMLTLLPGKQKDIWKTFNRS